MRFLEESLKEDRNNIKTSLTSNGFVLKNR